MLDYREVPPPAELAPWIRCFWFLRAGPGRVEPVVPDGRLEIVLHRATPFVERSEDGRLRRQSPILVAGQLTEPIHVGPLEEADVVGVRFRTAGAREALGCPLDELTDRVVALGDVAPRLATSLQDAVRAPRPVHALSVALSSVLHDGRRTSRRHVLSAPAEQLLVRGVSVGETARRLGCSERTLARITLADVGLAPKTLQRVARFRRYYGLLQAGRPGSRAALASGYYDQTHANRDFRAFAEARDHFSDPRELAKTLLSDPS